MQTDIYVTKVILSEKSAFSDLLGFLVLISSSGYSLWWDPGARRAGL